MCLGKTETMKICRALHGIAYEQLTHAEKVILQVLREAGYLDLNKHNEVKFVTKEVGIRRRVQPGPVA